MNIKNNSILSKKKFEMIIIKKEILMKLNNNKFL